jgi:hypothetical protein
MSAVIKIRQQKTRSKRNERKWPQLEGNTEYQKKYYSEHDKSHRKK